MELQQFLEENFDLKFLKWTEIILQEDKAVKLDSMYILVRDQNYCDLIFVDGKGKKRKIENVSKDALKVDFPLLDLSNLTPGLILDWKTKLGGLDGAAATIQVGDVYTVENEEEARIMNVGDETNAVFDFYIPKGNPGQPGADGNDGSNGLNGTNVLQGNTVPNNTLGSNGDSYINVSTADIYSKSSGLWNLTGNIKGKQGDAGANGSNAQSFNFKGNVATYASLPASGNVINDAYFNEADSKIYVYNGTSFPVSGSGISVGDVPSSVKTWTTADVGLVQGSERLRNDGIYVVNSGKTSTITPPENDSDTWKLVGINWNTPYRDYVNPTLEVGAIALSGSPGTPTSSTTRGRTVSYIDIAYANQLELIGDMRFQNIFYYTSTNVYISTQVINAKVFTPTIPPTATKFKLSLYHITNTQTVTQAELNALIVNLYSATSINLNNVISNSKISTLVANDYNSFSLNLGENVYKELGGINVTDGSDANNNIRIRTSRIKLSSGNYSISQTVGYIISRVVNYKNGVFVNYGSLSDFTIDNATVNEIRLVWSKSVSTDVITQAEVDSFSFTLLKNNTNKFTQINEKINNIQSSTTSSSWFSNKKMSSLGDSITFGFIPRNYTGYPGQLDSYAKQTATLLGMNWENKGISGSTIGEVTSGDTTTRDPMVDRFSSMATDAKVVTFMGGTNDLRNISQLGTMDDRIKTTYYGALHILIQGLLNKYIYSQSLTLGKDILIVGITPIKIYPDSTHNSLKMINYVNAMKEVCAYYSIPCFDAYNLSGLTPSEFRTLQGTETGYTDMYNPLVTDGVHPTKEGNAIFAQRLGGFLKSLVV